jgi:hypothetical protein
MPTEMVTLDGSSTATALASGLAAVLLAILSNDTGKTWDRHEKIDNVLVLLEIRSIGNTCRSGTYSVSILETRTLKGDSGVFQKMVDWVLSKTK